MIKIIKEELSRKINEELPNAETDEQKAYVAGLSDAIDIVKEVESRYMIGKEYYVIMGGNYYNNYQNRIIKMKLKRINTTKRGTYFCFDSDKEDVNLSNPVSLKLRVHETEEQAELYINTAMLREYF